MTAGAGEYVRRWPARLCMLVLCAVAVAAPTAARAGAVDGIVAGVETRLARLSRLGHGERNSDPAVAEIVAEGLAAIEKGRAALGDGGAAVDRCRLDLMRGALYLGAAEASAAGGEARKTYLNEALTACRGVRVEYRDMALALLGYLQESRVHRLRGDAAAAEVALAPLISGKLTLGSPALKELRRAGLLAKLEITLLTDPSKAVGEAERLRLDPLLAGRELWLGRTDWLTARACSAAAAKMTRDEAQTLRSRATSLLRSPSVQKAAPAYERLALFASLDAAAPGVMTREEWIDWAGQLAFAGAGRAIEAYRRARAMGEGPLPADAEFALAVELYKADRWAEAAASCEAVRAAEKADGALAVKAGQLLVGALTKHHVAAPKDDGAADRLSAALADLAGAETADEAVRLDALRQWAALQSRRAGQAACVAMLERHEAFTSRDAYLAGVHAAGRWGAACEGGAEATRDEARRVCDFARRARGLAAADASADLEARAALLEAIVLSSPPLNDRHAALTVLKEARGVLADTEATATAAGWLRVRLMLDAGLTAEALKNLPAPSEADSPEMLCRIAGLLAERVDASDTIARGRVVALCRRAMGRVVGDGSAYRRVARRCATILLKVGSTVEARQLLARLLADEAIKADRRAFLECSLTMVEALRRGGEPGKADAMLKELAASHPESVEAHLARAKMKMKLGEPKAAAEACRRARAVARAGSVPWCRATLQLAAVLEADGHAKAAGDILRVAAALYPAFGNAELKAEMKQLARRTGGRK